MVPNIVLFARSHGSLHTKWDCKGATIACTQTQVGRDSGIAKEPWQPTHRHKCVKIVGLRRSHDSLHTDTQVGRAMTYLEVR